MTEQWALDKARDSLADAEAAIDFGKPTCRFNVGRLENTIAQALEEAVAAERERCAKEKQEIIDYAKTVDWIEVEAVGSTPNMVRLYRFLDLLGVVDD
jgi:hypothetical protein